MHRDSPQIPESVRHRLRFEFRHSEGDTIEYAKRGTILNAIPATQVEVNVVDNKGKPVDAMWVNFGLKRKIEWVDTIGKQQQANTSIHHWIRADASGKGVFGTLPGMVKIRAAKDGWSQTKEIEIRKDDRPIIVTIQRDLAPKKE